MDKKQIYLLCNAHLDPVWLWQKAEGVAETLSTFRIAVDFCEKYDGFVFNHNESMLYEWVKEFEPETFEKIKNLVKKGKWNIIGGWYLQPDVLMPCGESIIRHIKLGHKFFTDNFGAYTKTAVNFDSFGHSRGLVQILKKSGFDNYIYMRPRDKEYGPFIWKGYDGSEIKTLKIYEWYNTPKGRAAERIEKYISEYPDNDISLLTWGIGNHGGGPSKKDWQDIRVLEKKYSDSIDFIHSNPDEYFEKIDADSLKTIDTSLVHCMIGCYTSLAEIKKGHRELENNLARCETMLCVSGAEYDDKKLERAERSLLFSEFHDSLPGTLVKKSAEEILSMIGNGKDIVSELSLKAFLKLCSGLEQAKEGEIPVFIFNPHPYEVEEDFEVEFQLAMQNPNENEVTVIKVRDENGVIVPCQNEKEDCCINQDWRKKVAFRTKAKPLGITRFDCELHPTKPYRNIKPFESTDEYIILKGKQSEVLINRGTGLIDKLCVNGQNMLKKGGIKLAVYKDNEDPWRMDTSRLDEFEGEFEIVSDDEAREFRGYPKADTHNVSVIENGELRTKVQVIMKYKKSYAVITYIISKESPYLDIEIKMLTNDVNKLVKLSFDTTLESNAKPYVQQMFGSEEAQNDGSEFMFQKWCLLDDGQKSLAVINTGNHGGSAENGKLNISLLRTAVYSAHPVTINGVSLKIAPDDRVHEHLDMGEREFRFRVCANEPYVDSAAEIFNRQPYVLSVFPSGHGKGKTMEGFMRIDNRHIILSALRKENEQTTIRLFNSSDKSEKCTMNCRGVEAEIEFSPYEVKTYSFDGSSYIETDMLGNKIY